MFWMVFSKLFQRVQKDILSELFFNQKFDNLYFFQLIPLEMDKFPLKSNDRKERFCTLSLPIRLVSKLVVDKTDVAAAIDLIQLYFFQSYPIIRWRNADIQFSLNAPSLWPNATRRSTLELFGNYIESANHFLLRVQSGAIKRPERITDQFLRKKWQLADDELQRGRNSVQQFNEEHYAAPTVKSAECKEFSLSFSGNFVY